MKKRIIPILLFLGYLFILIKILVLKDLAMVRVGHMRFNFGGTQDGPANLVPFKTILFYLQGHNGFLIAFINVIGNIIALVPFGFLVPFVFSKLNWKKIILIAFITGLTIELTQVILHIGIFDIDDVILNALGVMIGYWKFNIFSHFSKQTQAILKGIVFGIMGVFILFYTLGFYKVVEMPVGIEPSINREPLPLLQNKANGEKGSTDCCDLCNGTGGTGVIVGIGNNDITIKSKRGKNEQIFVNTRTKIKNSKGDLNKLGLRIGDHVTVVIDESETASLVLVCGIAK